MEMFPHTRAVLKVDLDTKSLLLSPADDADPDSRAISKNGFISATRLCKVLGLDAKRAYFKAKIQGEDLLCEIQSTDG